MKVNLEDQSRQKVSFSFSQTKKPLQSLFFISSSPEKSGADPAAPSHSGSGKGHHAESKTEHRSPSTVQKTRTNALSQPAISPTKLKTDLSKTHFKKHILNASVTDELPSSVEGDSQSNVRPSSPQTAETHNVAPESRITAILQTLAAASGKDGVSHTRTESNSKGHKSTSRTHSDCAPPGFDSDGESGQSSTRKSSDSKSQSSSSSRRKDEKKHSSSSHSEEKEKSSSKRSETYERSSSHSKSDRDSRYTSSRSSRSDRKRSRSRSRSRSRGSRTSSSHSRLDRSRGERSSRSDRSHYHESDRRSYRSSPRRERRRSRSRTDRNRDSSESEEDRRKARTRTGESSRSSAYSSSHKESRSSSHVKSTSKSADSSEFDKSYQSSKSERSSRRLSDTDSQHRGSSVTDHHKSNTGHKSETSSKLSSPRAYTHSHSSEKHQKSDSERENSHTSDKRSRSDEYSKNSHKTNKTDSRHSNSSVSSHHEDTYRTQDRKSNDTFHTPQKALFVSTVESGPENEERYEQMSHKIKKTSSRETNDSKLTEHEKGEEIRNASLDVNDNLNKADTFVETNKKAQSGQTAMPNQILASCESNDVMYNRDSVDHSPESLFKSSSVPREVQNSINEETQKAEMVDPSRTSLTSNYPDNVSQNPNLMFLDSQNHIDKDLGDAGKKSSIAYRKSRWDIVGQNAEDHSNTIHISETKPDKADVKMDTSKYGGKPDTEIKENMHAGTHFITKDWVLESDRACMSDSCKHQSALTEASFDTNASEQATKKPFSNDENTIVNASKSRHPQLNLLMGQSGASDSDNSEYDSDCGEAIKRLHSVVVVMPKHSLPTTEDNTGQNSAGQNSDSSEKMINSHQIQGHDPAHNAVCQSQSNMIDSTSHSESSQLNISVHMPAIENSSLVSCLGQQVHQQYISSGNEIPFSQYKQDNLSSVNRFSDKNGYNLLWTYTQAEQPSSSCPQPDSSHGTQLIDGRLTETLSYSQMQSNDPVTDPSTVQIRQDSNEIHPDSLTNDHGVYSGEKTAAESSGSILCQGFVQGHEISSNSKGPAATEPTKEDTFKSLRSRGPPKKRRPELESDSDNEAEAGPTSKKERRGDTLKDIPVKTEVQLPMLKLRVFQDAAKWKDLAKSKKMPPYFDLIEENLYLTERKKSKSHRDIKRMQCECPMLSREERSKGVMACGEDCLNRLLMIECSSRCLNGAYCSNRRFQMKQHADFEVILTEDKGWGLRAARDMPANTFVLEYCGEVLDHKEFKARVKEYARMKNIHYYFMSLKNNEIIDATLKGNCSRFMNHSCEPNCETQKWTVNGQLRVGFFTTKAVTEGTELTFDYQFQRYGKEAQKCYCGAPSCRGFLGGENRVSVRAAGGRMKKDRNRKSALTTVDEELEALLDNGEGLYDEKQVVALCRLMVRVETMEQKLLCLKLIQDTQNPSCLKQFLDHHGLSLLWIFMVELSEAKGNSANNIKLQLEILKTLAVLPISTKNMLEESKVLTLIQRWAQTCPQPAENDGYSSENTSRAQTPLNTPDCSNSRAGPEMDHDSAKPSVFRRLKIISENSLDSAMSDASKASDGKEDDEDDEDDDDESSHAGLPVVQETKREPEAETEDPVKEPENSIKKEEEEESNEKSLDIQDESKSSNDQDDTEMMVETEEVKEDTSETLMEESGDVKEPHEKEKEEGENELIAQVFKEEPEQVTGQDTVSGEEIKNQVSEGDEPAPAAPAPPEAVLAAPVLADAVPVDSDSALTDSAPTDSASTDSAPTDSASIDSAPTDSAPTDSASTDSAPTDSASTDSAPIEPVLGDYFPTESTQTDSAFSQPAQAESTPNAPVLTPSTPTEPAPLSPPPNEPAQTDSTPTEPIPAISEPATSEPASEPMEVQVETQVEVEDSEKANTDQTSGQQNDCSAAAADVVVSSEVPEVSVPSAAASVEPSVVGTPSQDDDEGLSDVESERSQEPQLSSMDISGMAARLLESWKDLKEVYRIPKKSQVEKEDRSRDRDTARPASGSRERERERERDKERDREREYERDRERERDRTPRSSESRRRRSLSPPSSYERTSRRTDERFDNVNSKTPRSVGGKERNKLSTEERRKLFEQEVAQREAQKQQQLQQQQQQQLQSLGYDPALAYASTSGFITYPSGYPVQAFVDPTNPNAGKVLLPTPPVDGALTYEQTPPLGLSSPSSTPQAAPVSNIPQQISTEPLPPGTSQPYTQPTVAPPDIGVAVLSVPAPAAPPVQGQSYTTLWDPTTQQTVTVQTAAQQYTTAPAQPQPQTAIYYQGQPCPTIYSIPTAYPQGSAPVIQAYADPAGNYLHSQPVYPGQQGVVVQQGGTVTTIVTSQTQELIVPNNIVDLPPPSPPKPKTIVLPPNWKVARDPEGKIYYYHIVTRQTQWDPPTWDGTTDATTMEHESEMDLGTPTYDENPSKFSTKTAEADTSSELAKKSKESFRKEMSQFIVHCLNPYRKPDCKLGRIINTEDFKHLARKLTHGVMNKELKACKNPEDLECNENVKHKTKEYIKKYMQRFGSVYRPKEDTEVY
ncbi:hypothetical protein NQD34_012193 [Periophthalmus magnuspinnatus]|nr:hypothetical protein NQD34_012193 [Periophthalmus magnuspinnatus]